MWDGCKNLQHQRRSDVGTRLKLSGTGLHLTLQQDEDHIYREGLFSVLLWKLMKAEPEASSSPPPNAAKIIPPLRVTHASVL